MLDEAFVTDTRSLMNCELCGLPTPTPPIGSDGHSFCCFGCKEVFRTFGSEILAAASLKRSPEDAPPPHGAATFLRIYGLHCSSCELLLQTAAMKREGIHSVSASYATGMAKIVYDPARVRKCDLPKILTLGGYRARLVDEGDYHDDDRHSLLRLFTGLILSNVVMMLYVAFYYPIYLGLVDRREFAPMGWIVFYAAPGAIFVLTTILVFYVGGPILRGAWTGLRTRLLNMDNLLAAAILSAYVYSVQRLVTGSLDLYFDAAAMIVVVVIGGRHLEQSVKIKATQELHRIISTRSSAARVRRGGSFEIMTADKLKPGDHVVIQAGEIIPADGIVIAGQGAVDESPITGEAFPMSYGLDQNVLGGAALVEGCLEIDVGPIPENRLDNLKQALWNVQCASRGGRNVSDRIVQAFVPAIFAVAVLVVGGLVAAGSGPEKAFLAGLATLIVSCPCAFGLAIPLTTAAGISTALRHGMLITGVDTFEKPAHFSVIAIDKTGTLSSGEMTVIGVIGPPEVARRAAAVERLTTHPIARAIARLDASLTGKDAEIHPGKGAIASVEGLRVVVGGRALFLTLGWLIPERLVCSAETLLTGDSVVSYVGWEGRAQGVIVTQDHNRIGWDSVIRQLRARGKVVLLTGARHPGEYAALVDSVYTGIPPEGKAAVIRLLKRRGAVAMIGDGSNDAPALAAADLGIAFGAPTSLAATAAHAVIPGNRLEMIVDVFSLIETVRRRIRQGIGWAFLYNAMTIPFAVTGLLNPLMAALAMSASSLFVVWNATRPIRLRRR